jgi:hypothetical protein
MSPVALPYSLLLLLSEFAVGGQLAIYAVDLRGQAARGFVRMGAALVAVVAAVDLWVVLTLAPLNSVNGYALEEHFWRPVRWHVELFVALAVLYAIALFWSNRTAQRIAGLFATLAALPLLFFLSGLIEGPTWSFAGTLLGLLSGGLAVAGVTLAMSLGHWYLVTPRLPERPLNEMIVTLLAILLLQALLLVANLVLPARLPPPSFTLPAGQNPALWLRAGVGIVLPLVLCCMAWRCSRDREMMSATGLLYLATGAVLAGQALACSLVFSTAIPG